MAEFVISVIELPSSITRKLANILKNVGALYNEWSVYF